MAKTKSGGTAKNLRSSRPKYLGIKLANEQLAKAGSVLVRQRGNKYYPGKNVAQGKDYTLFALKTGRVTFSKKRKRDFDGKIKKITVVNIQETQTKTIS
jgi:large subunit ribosomal protein L27